MKKYTIVTSANDQWSRVRKTDRMIYSLQISGKTNNL